MHFLQILLSNNIYNIDVKIRLNIQFILYIATITTVVLAIKKLGRDTHGQQAGTGLWCWIKLDYKDNRIHPSDIRLMFISGKLWEILTYVLSFSVYMLLKITTFLEVWLNTHFCTAFGIFTEWSFFTHSTEIWLKGNKKVTELHIYFSRTFSWHSVSWMKELNHVLCIVYLHVSHMVENTCSNLFTSRDKETVTTAGVVSKERI